MGRYMTGLKTEEQQQSGNCCSQSLIKTHVNIAFFLYCASFVFVIYE